ncbi:MAG: hypothetical protein RLZZ241_1221 [Bacteroidota bacterium]|jgi:hypothetical protein
MNILLHPAYFPNAVTLASILQGEVIWEVHDNYQKQTYRNRCIICNDRGRQLLNIPIQHTGGNQGRQATRNVRPECNSKWQRLHWRSLETAYRSAPFFEYYEDDLRDFFDQSHQTLLELNMASMQLLCGLIGIDFPQNRSTKFEEIPEEFLDGRLLVSAKSGPAVALPTYPQVFEERHGFIPDLSGLDLLFNEGPSALEYLSQIQLPWHA